MYSTVFKKKTTDVMYSLEKYFLLKNKKQKQERQQMAMAPITHVLYWSFENSAYWPMHFETIMAVFSFVTIIISLSL